MEKTLCVAKYLYDMYYEQKGVYMDEMKMHKLMYFVQRESLMNSKELLFEEPFYGWKFGPVLKSVRSEYMCAKPFEGVRACLSDSGRALLKSVLDRYGELSSWTLSRMSHDEFSWKNARKGLEADENGDVNPMPEVMMLDAVRESLNRKNTVNV